MTIYDDLGVASGTFPAGLSIDMYNPTYSHSMSLACNGSPFANPVTIDETRRPILLHARMQQEWLQSGLGSGK